MREILEYIIGFAALILAQIFIFDNINIMGYVNPFVYIMLVVMLPMKMNNALLLAIAFAVGLVMDFLTGKSGLCAMCLTLIAFFRPLFLTLTAGRDVVGSGGTPSIQTMGITHFVVYLSLMTLMYNIPYFLLEIMTFSGLGHTILRIVLSSLFTVVIIYISHLFLFRNKSWQ